MKRFVTRLDVTNRMIFGSLIFVLTTLAMLLSMYFSDPPRDVTYGDKYYYGFLVLSMGVVVLLSPLLLWTSICRIRYLKRVVSSGDEVAARVANVQSYRASKRDWFHSRLRVTCYYEYDGETHRFEENIAKDSRISKLEDGDEITLIVDPEDSSRAVIACLFSDGTPGTPPSYSDIGGLFGGSICSLGLLCVYWLPVLWGETPFTVAGQYTKEFGFIFWSMASVGFGLMAGTVAGKLARPFLSAVVGGILLGIPALLYMWLVSVNDGLFSWSCALLVGGVGGMLGGIVGRNGLQQQLEMLGPALAMQENEEELAAAKTKRAAEMEAAELEAAEAEKNLDRCLSCGHEMESYVTCPECGWTYL